MFPFLKVTKLCTFKYQKLTKEDHDEQWANASDCIGTLFLPFTYYWEETEGNIYPFVNKIRRKHNFFYSSPGIHLILKYILDSTLKTSNFHLHLRMLEMHFNLLQSVSNCINQLKSINYVFLDHHWCIWSWSPHCYLEIRDAIHAIFSFL